MVKQVKILVGGTVLVLLLLWILGDKTAVPRVGNPPPQFSLNDLSGNTVKLSDYKGKALIINFWNSWCLPCEAEMSEFKALYPSLKDKGIEIIGIASGEAAEPVREFTTRGGYNWKILLDRDSKLKSNYLISGTPTSFFIDKQGIIRYIQIGATDIQQTQAWIKVLT